MAQRNVTATFTESEITVNVASGPGSAGQSVGTSVATSLVQIQNQRVGGPIEFKAGADPWVILDEEQGKEIPIDLSVTQLLFRKASPVASAIPVKITLLAFSDLFVGGKAAIGIPQVKVNPLTGGIKNLVLQNFAQRAFVPDIGVGGSEWYSDGTRNRLTGGRCVLYALQAPRTGVPQIAGQNLAEGKIRAGTLRPGDILNIYNAVGKSGLTDGFLRAVRVSTSAGQTGGSVLQSGNSFPAAASRSAGELLVFQVVNATTLRILGSGTGTWGFGGNATAALMSDVTVPNMDDNDLYVLNVITSSGATDTPTQNTFTIELLTCGS